MGNTKSVGSNFKVIDGERIYIDPERRADRRRRARNERVERLLRNFGLDRRNRIERRSQATSWLLTSRNVVNM